MISLAEARERVLGRCVPLAPRTVPLAEAIGCVTAAPVVAAVAVPPFVNSAMDGFAVRSADTAGADEPSPVAFDVVATVAAGGRTDGRLERGQAIRIMTGAPLPNGADAVVPVERSRRSGSDQVELTLAVAPGASVREAATDIAVGDEVIGVGTVLGPAHLGVLASIGLGEVQVVPRPRVGVLSTGDELVPAGRTLGPAQIHDSNRVMLVALVARSGFEAVDVGLLPDNPEVVAAALHAAAAHCDVLVSSGGVSMGDFDVMKMVLDRIAAMDWMQIAIRPAKPFASGLLGDVPVLGLPGNPVSSLVSFELLARPALRRMAGHSHPDRPRVRAIASEAFNRRPDGKVHFDRVSVVFADGEFLASPVAAQGSHQLAATAAADGLAELPDGIGVPAGAAVDVILLDPSTVVGLGRR